MNRRLYLSLAGSVVASLAGCSDAELEPTTREPEANSNRTSDHSTETDGTTTSESEHPDKDAASAEEDAINDTDAADEPMVHEEYDTTDIRVVTPTGDELGSATAAIADTPDLRYLGLSDTEYLPEDRGMLFVFDSVAERTFVMREMDFGIDIVYADAEGMVTSIHHAPEPGPGEDGATQRYEGRGQYVLEVGYEWTKERGVSEGDRLEFDLETSADT